jgi:diacylglycerol kinase family enzyme
MATRVQIVVTPGSGSGGAMRVANCVRQGLVAQGYAPSVRAFRTLGELEQWAKTCDATFSYLVAIGGDATVSAAAVAAVRLVVPFVPVPSGFGNLFTSAFEHPSEPKVVVDLVGQGDLVWADVGFVGPEMFLSHQSYGVVARIQEATEQARRPRQRLLRLFSYYQMAAKHLSEASLDAIQVEIDGHPIPGKAALVTIANVETYRGFLSLTPAASPIDGLFDVCVISRTTRAGVLGQLVKLMLGAPGWRDKIAVYRGRNVRVIRRAPQNVRIRGEALPLLVPVGSLERLRARQIAAEAAAPVVTLAPRERAASVRVPGEAPGHPARSRRPVVAGGGG